MKIDRYFCISLYEYPERQELFKERFPELVSSPIFEWYVVHKDTENPKRGCYTSHKNVMALAKSMGLSRVVIFEDDADLLVPWTQYVSFIDSYKEPDDYTLLLLGYLPIRTTVVRKDLLKVLCAYCLHAYVYNCTSLLEIPDYSGNEIDGLLLCNNLVEAKKFAESPLKVLQFYDPNNQVYAVVPMQFRQRTSNSTITGVPRAGFYEGSRDFFANMSSGVNLIHAGSFFVTFLVFLVLIAALVISKIFIKKRNILFILNIALYIISLAFAISILSFIFIFEKEKKYVTSL